MDGRLLLDTNIVIALFSGDNLICDNLGRAQEIYLSSTILGELYYGAFKSHRIEENLEKTTTFIAHVTVLVCDSGTAQEYGLIKNMLREKGRPLPENDIWIAALARQHNLILVTGDHHFKEVDDLAVQWQ